MDPLLEARGIYKYFPKSRNLVGRPKEWVRAVDGVDLTINTGQTLGLVGESGSGKSSLARLLLRLIEVDRGEIMFAGANLRELGRSELERFRCNIQMIFQDPRSSLDPLMSVAESVEEPLIVHRQLTRQERHRTVRELLEIVSLAEYHMDRYPEELSGGQRQRVAIARALALRPQLIVCDEAVSALDVSVQAQVVNLLESLQDEFGLSYLFIGHDLSVVHHVSDEIAVMYLGRIVERGPSDEVFTHPQHPYTEALLSASPAHATGERIILSGDMPDPAHPPEGCRFHTRCPYVMDVCRRVDPALETTRPGSEVACHLHTVDRALDGDSVSATLPPGSAPGGGA